MSDIRNQNTGTQHIRQMGDNNYYDMSDETFAEMTDWLKHSAERLKITCVGPLSEQYMTEMRHQLAVEASDRWKLPYTRALRMVQSEVVHLFGVASRQCWKSSDGGGSSARTG
jgi:hypothetical protein